MEDKKPRSLQLGKYGAKPLMESQILAAQEKSRSAFEAARTLGVSYNTYKKYARLYGILENLKNPTGKGIEKKFAIRNKKYNIEDLINGKCLKYPLHKFKNKLFNSGYLPKVCGSCGFSEERITDGRMPMLIDFLDGNLNNRKLENIRPLCYNCFFLLVGDRNVKNWYEENGMPDEEDGIGTTDQMGTDI
ncbi:MAG: hypothetical protein EBS19_09255 [Spirochaetia bacterium]|nr:hypothetical protein [Spirochaetia bacterium]